MPSVSYMNGLSSVCAPFAVVQSNYDGADCIDEIMGELDRMSDDPACQGRPVPVYSVRGTIGFIEVDLVYLYMLGGVPLIMDPGIVLRSAENGQIDEIQTTGRLISGLFSRDNDRVFSIGYVDDPCDAYAYAVEFTRHNVPSPDTHLSADLVNSYIAANPDTMMRVGTIQNPGGTVFDVYAIGPTESAMFRPDKDFMGGEPYSENDIDGTRGKIEVLLCGGNPDIVCIGSVCSADGWVFNVWVPNERGYVDCGTHMIEQGDIPPDVLYVDSEELAQAYMMYDDKLRADEAEVNGDSLPSEDDDTDVPDFDYEEYYSEEDDRREKASKS